MITDKLVKRCCEAVARANGNKQPGAWKTYRHTVQTTLAIMEVAFSHMASDEAEEKPDFSEVAEPHYGVPDTFENDLTVLLNRYAMVPPNGMPDYVVAEYLTNCLANLNTAMFSQHITARRMVSGDEEEKVRG